MKKNIMNQVAQYTLPNKVEDIEDLKEMSLVEISKSLLQATVRASGILNARKIDPESLKEFRLVLGFLHAMNTAYQTKLNAFKLVGAKEKVEALKKLKGRK